MMHDIDLRVRKGGAEGFHRQGIWGFVVPLGGNKPETLKRFDIGTVTKRGYDEAVVTAGGVDTSEIDPRNMRSRLVPGLSFAGEIIDADAYTGGFNLQIAWATGRAAANGID